MAKDEVTIENDQILIKHLEVKNPDVVKRLAAAEDPEAEVHRMMREGSRMMLQFPEITMKDGQPYLKGKRISPQVWNKMVENVTARYSLNALPLVTPREVPQLRLTLLARWAKGGLFDVLEDDKELARVDGVFHRHLLAQASLWWVREEMCDLVSKAAPTVPADVRASDLRLPGDNDFGLMVLAKPYVGIDAIGDFRQQVQVQAIAWGRSMSPDMAYPCLSLCFYRYFAADELEDRPETAGMEAGWCYLGRTEWPINDLVDGFSLPVQLSDRQKVSMVEDRRYFAALCTLIDHKLSDEDLEYPSRETWRRVERELRHDKDKARQVSTVRIVRLREVVHSSRNPEEGKRTVAWTHRWPSKAHIGWRWYGPGRAQRHLVPISPSIKGPKDLPLVIKDTVNVWTR